MADIEFDVTEGADGKPVAKADEEDLKAIDERAVEKVKTALGVTALDIDSLATKLKPILKEPEVDIERTDWIAIIQGDKPKTNHRYTIDVFDLGENAVVNIGHADEGRKLKNTGISARTKSHIQLHTNGDPTETMAVLGGKCLSGIGKIIDTKSALANNQGFSCVTNGNAWVDAQGQLSLVSRTSEASLRSNAMNVRVQADEGPVDIGAKGKISIGSQKAIGIVASSSVTLDDNHYATPFSEKLIESSAAWAVKDNLIALDVLTSIHSIYLGMKKVDKLRKAGKLSWETLPKNDVGKMVVDSFKVGSTVARFVRGKVDDQGQIKIAAQTFASITGDVAASLYGKLSASVSSLVSASLLGGTASVKGLAWTSVWAGAGVSVKTNTGTASLGSDKGKVSVSGGSDVSVKSEEGKVSVSSKGMAELTSDTATYVAAGGGVTLAAGKGSGTGLLALPKYAYLGTVTDPDDFAKAKNDGNAGVEITIGDKTQVSVFVGNSEFLVAKDEIRLQLKGTMHLEPSGDLFIKGKKVLIG